MKKFLLLFAITCTISSCAYAAVDSEPAISLTWNDNSDNESAFEIERSTDGEAWESYDILPADTVAYTDNGVELGNTPTWHPRL